MIQLNKNLLHVRDTETKEFRPLNVLGTYNDIIDEELNAVSNRPLTNKAITKKFGEMQTSIFQNQMKITELKTKINEEITPNLKKPWSMFCLDSSSNPGELYYFTSSTTSPIETLDASSQFATTSNNRAYFRVPIDGNIIITINAWMSSTGDKNDIGLFIYDYTDSTWYDYSVAGLGVLGEAGQANYISITSCPIRVTGGHIIQVVARHHNGDIKVEDLSSYGTAYGIPYNNGNTITFRYI